MFLRQQIIQLLCKQLDHCNSKHSYPDKKLQMSCQQDRKCSPIMQQHQPFLPSFHYFLSGEYRNLHSSSSTTQYSSISSAPLQQCMKVLSPLPLKNQTSGQSNQSQLSPSIFPLHYFSIPLWSISTLLWYKHSHLQILHSLWLKKREIRCCEQNQPAEGLRCCLFL